MFHFHISVFLKALRMETQNRTSAIHNFSYWIPILMWDTSMSLWLNSLIFYIQIFIIGEGHNFNPFSSFIFP